MSVTVLLAYLLIQFVVQYIMYNPVKNFLFKIHSKYRNTIPFIKVEFFVLNILVSLFVFVFTGRGGMTGMTNTFASVLLGVVMAIQYKCYVRDIISGKYYKDLEREAKIRQRQKEILARYN